MRRARTRYLSPRTASTVSATASLGSLQSQPPGRKVSRYALGAAPDWYRAMQGTTLGDDLPPGETTLSTPTIADPDTRQWQTRMLATAQDQYAYLKAQEDRARLQKWIQIAATLSIPLAGAIWRVILGRRRSRMSL